MIKNSMEKIKLALKGIWKDIFEDVKVWCKGF